MNFKRFDNRKIRFFLAGHLTLKTWFGVGKGLVEKLYLNQIYKCITWLDNILMV